MDSPQQRVSVLTNDNLQRLLASQAKPVVQSVLASPTGSRDEPQVEFSRAQHVISRSTAQFTGQVAEMGKLEEMRVTSLQDSRLVGVPTMGRVIQMSELNRLALPEMKIVLQCDQKLEDLDTLELPNSQSNNQPVSTYLGQPGGNLREILPAKKHQQPAVEELMMPPISSTTSSKMEPALIELVGQSLPHNLPTPPPPAPISEGSGIQNKVADRTFPAIVTEELVAEYRTANMYDTVWRCQGGRYKVHKLVLALSSPLLRELLSCQPEGDVARPVIYTPDISSLAVKAILCLFYTGKVNVTRGKIGEVNAALKMLKFHGDNVTVLPSQELVKQEIVPEYDISSSGVLVELERSDVVELEKSGLGSKTPGEKVKAEKRRREEEDSDEEWNVDTAFDPDLQAEGDSDDDWWEAESKRIAKKRKVNSVKSERWSDEEEDGKALSGFRRGRKSLKCPDTHEMFRTRGTGKGERSFQLALDLFDGKHVDFIYVCHCCYAIFDTFKKLAVHKDDAHHENPDQYGPHHTSSITEYNCPKCSQVIRVKHIAWFCKHLRFCRENNDIANALVRPEEEDSDGEENGFSGARRKYSKRPDIVEGSNIYMKDTDERLRITGEAKGRNVQTLSKILVGRVVDYIWACKVCYSVHLTEEELKRHKTTHHVDGEKIGKHWNANSDNYTCPHCDQVQNSRHVVWFIYHMRKCNMSNVPLIKKEVNEEEDTEDEEEMEADKNDPEQIVLKTLNIRTERSEWLCESLLGKIVDRIFCCHVCYTFYETAEQLRAHFRPLHGDLANRVQNGAYYNAEKLGFQCPSCHNVVCKKQSNSIFFIYHLRKCSGQQLPLEKACLECGKVFSQYPSFKAHIDSHKALRSFMCHVCTKVFPSNARLNYHVQYVHSAYKPFPCTKCSKAYKRKAELLEHEEMSHSTHFNYSCDKCGKQFYGKKNLALHMKTHYTDEEKKHVCTVCGYRFAKIKFLKNHMTTHSDIRQYACEICGARVKTRDTLKQHRKKLHNLLTPVPKTAEVEEAVATPVTVVEEQVLAEEDPAVANFVEARVINTL